MKGEPYRRITPTALARNAPPQSGLRPASSTFYGIAATGSYVRFNSLRDAPPGGEAFNLPHRGRGTAAVGGGGRGALRERVVRIY